MSPRLQLVITTVERTLRDVIAKSPEPIESITPVLIGLEKGSDMAHALVFEPGGDMHQYLVFAQRIIREENLTEVALSAEAWAVSETEMRTLPPMDVRTPSVMEGRREIMTITATDGERIWCTTADITRPKHQYTIGPFEEPAEQSNPSGTSVGAALLASVSRNLEEQDESARKEQEDRGGADDDPGPEGDPGAHAGAGEGT